MPKPDTNGTRTVLGSNRRSGSGSKISRICLYLPVWGQTGNRRRRGVALANGRLERMCEQQRRAGSSGRGVHRCLYSSEGAFGCAVQENNGVIAYMAFSRLGWFRRDTVAQTINVSFDKREGIQCPATHDTNFASFLHEAIMPYVACTTSV